MWTPSKLDMYISTQEAHSLDRGILQSIVAFILWGDPSYVIQTLKEAYIPVLGTNSIWRAYLKGQDFLIREDPL